MEINLFEMLIVPTFKILWVFWPLYVTGLFLVLIATLAPLLVDRYKNKKRFEAGTSYKDDRDLKKYHSEMGDVDFEEYIAEMFRRLGYGAERVGGKGDHGFDVKLEKEGRVTFVQCKRYALNNKVGEPELRNFLGSLNHEYVRHTAFFVTTSYFTEHARQFAAGESIELVDGDGLVEYVRRAQKNGFSYPYTKTSNVCPKCGSELIEKNGKFGKFLGCNAFPKCDFTKSRN